jgi:hypothetical protein
MYSRKKATHMSKFDLPNDYFNGLFNSFDDSQRPDITQLDINEIKSCGFFTPEERAAEYRRRGKSPSGVIDGVYNDEFRGNDTYNDVYRDWDSNA